MEEQNASELTAAALDVANQLSNVNADIQESWVGLEKSLDQLSKLDEEEGRPNNDKKRRKAL